MWYAYIHIHILPKCPVEHSPLATKVNTAVQKTNINKSLTYIEQIILKHRGLECRLTQN